MQFDRLRANLLYLSVISVIIYATYKIQFDKAYPTGVLKNAVVKSIAPKHSKYSLKVAVTLRTEDGIDIVRVVDAESNFRVGQTVQLKEYKSTIRGIIKYRIIL